MIAWSVIVFGWVGFVADGYMHPFFYPMGKIYTNLTKKAGNDLFRWKNYIKNARGNLLSIPDHITSIPTKKEDIFLFTFEYLFEGLERF